MQTKTVHIVVCFLCRPAGIAPFERLADKRPLSHRCRQGIDDIDFKFRIVLFDVRRRLCRHRLGGRKTGRDRKVHDFFRALLRKFQKVLIVRFIVEHGRPRKPARAQFVIEIHILLILCEIVEAVFEHALLFHGECERNKFDVVLPDKILIQIAGRIGRKREFVHCLLSEYFLPLYHNFVTIAIFFWKKNSFLRKALEKSAPKRYNKAMRAGSCQIMPAGGL